LYKELDEISDETELQLFQSRLSDRFGSLPQPAKSLINTIRLRWLAKKIGFEKLSIKFNRMTGYFAGDQESPYFQSEAFGKVLSFIQNNPDAAILKELKGRLTLRFEEVRTVEKGILLLEELQ